MYKLAIFDMDGTILNTLDDLTDATNFVLKKYGRTARSVDEIRNFVGNGIVLLLERAFSGSDSLDKKIIEDFKEYYGAHCACKTREYSGITTLLERLKESGVKTAVISNKPDFAVKELCEKYFPRLFDYPIGNIEGIPTKPDPAAVNNLLKSIGLEKRDVVFIGDSDVDIATGLNADLDTVGVSWGFKGREFLLHCGAKCVVDSTSELFSEITGGGRYRVDGGTRE